MLRAFAFSIVIDLSVPPTAKKMCKGTFHQTLHPLLYLQVLRGVNFWSRKCVKSSVFCYVAMCFSPFPPATFTSKIQIIYLKIYTFEHIHGCVLCCAHNHGQRLCKHCFISRNLWPRLFGLQFIFIVDNIFPGRESRISLAKFMRLANGAPTARRLF